MNKKVAELLKRWLDNGLINQETYQEIVNFEENSDPNQKSKPKPGQMSPQQMKNILEAMQNQEQKVQQKMNAEKQKGAKVRTEKDW